MASLEVAYRERTGAPLPKVELAYEILNAREEDPKLILLDARRKKAFQNIVEKVFGLFGA